MNLQKIRRAWRTNPNCADANTLTLAGAIWGLHPPRSSHAAVLDQLPSFIEAELAQASSAPEYSALKRHLLICKNCVTVYFDLLEIAQLEEHTKFPQLTLLPRPELSFLKSRDRDTG